MGGAGTHPQLSPHFRGAGKEPGDPRDRYQGKLLFVSSTFPLLAYSIYSRIVLPVLAHDCIIRTWRLPSLGMLTWIILGMVLAVT